MNDIISLQLPREARYISVARLAVSGISMQMGFDIDCIEDLKVIIAEACINALKLTEDDRISIEFEVKDDKIIIKVKDVKDVENNNFDHVKELRMGQLIINSLADSVKYTDLGIEIIKDLGVDINGYD